MLGSVLESGLAIADVLPFLKPHHFYSARHRHIYAAMAALFDRAGAIDDMTRRSEERSGSSLVMPAYDAFDVSTPGTTD